jgi:flavodoxin
MKVLVTYFSRSGQTKKVAEAIYEAIPCEKEIRELKDVTSLDGYDLSYIGFPIEKFGPGENVKKWLQRMVTGKDVALFVTHAAWVGFPDLDGWLDACSQAASEANIIGRFNCQGELSQAFAEMAAQIPDPMMQGFAQARPMTIGHPTEEELEEAKSWAEDVIRKL